MIYLVYIIPIVLLMFTIGDSISDSLIVRKSKVNWWTWHIPNWIRRYSTNLLMSGIWFYIAGIRLYTVFVFVSYIFFLWGVWKLIYLILTKKLQIKVE